MARKEDCLALVRGRRAAGAPLTGGRAPPYGEAEENFGEEVLRKSTAQTPLEEGYRKQSGSGKSSGKSERANNVDH